MENFIFQVFQSIPRGSNIAQVTDRVKLCSHIHWDGRGRNEGKKKGWERRKEEEIKEGGGNKEER